MNYENIIQPCYVALYDIVGKQRKNKCDKRNDNNNNNGNNELMQQSEVEQLQLKACFVRLERLRDDVGAFSKSSKTKEQQLEEKYNLKLCVVILNDVNRCPIEAAPVSIDEEIPTNENESVQSISSRTESSYVIVTDKRSRNGVIRMNRDNYSMRHSQFAIDDFMNTTKATHNFLTRFHPTQYAGLTETFNRYIYVSKITGNRFYEPIDFNGTSDVLVAPFSFQLIWCGKSPEFMDHAYVF